MNEDLVHAGKEHMGVLIPTGTEYGTPLGHQRLWPAGIGPRPLYLLSTALQGLSPLWGPCSSCRHFLPFVSLLGNVGTFLSLYQHPLSRDLARYFGELRTDWKFTLPKKGGDFTSQERKNQFVHRKVPWTVTRVRPQE